MTQPRGADMLAAWRARAQRRPAFHDHRRCSNVVRWRPGDRPAALGVRPCGPVLVVMMCAGMSALVPLSSPFELLLWAAPLPGDFEFVLEDPLALDYLG